jgi:alkylation response protein AidB-like acyl-CoA dehydrogenase
MEQLYFTEEHKMLRDMVRDFARNEVKPLAQELDEKGGFPHESVKRWQNWDLWEFPGMKNMAVQEWTPWH